VKHFYFTEIHRQLAEIYGDDAECSLSKNGAESSKIVEWTSVALIALVGLARRGWI
jgi:hypothetical protein